MFELPGVLFDALYALPNLRYTFLGVFLGAGAGALYKAAVPSVVGEPMMAFALVGALLGLVGDIVRAVRAGECSWLVRRLLSPTRTTSGNWPPRECRRVRIRFRHRTVQSPGQHV